MGSGERGSYRYPHMEMVSKADLLIVFARRIALPQGSLQKTGFGGMLNKNMDYIKLEFNLLLSKLVEVKLFK